jgi:osmoprotectant transport system permease protein
VKHRSLIRWGLLVAGLLAAGLAPLPRRAVEVRVASKKFTESVILGDMLEILGESRGIDVVHYRELGSTRLVFDALAAGEVDAYPEYVGTVTQEILAGQNLRDDAAVRAALARQGIGMSSSLGFSNTYALAMTRKRATELDLARISDLKRLPELRLALTHEFLDRADGWPALAKHYDLSQKNVAGVDHDIAYRALLRGEVDIIDAYSTDAMIGRNDLVLLEDDQKFFPRYDAVWLYRLDLDARYPQFVAAMRELEGSLSEAKMQGLNDVVESRQMTESQAAADFLNRQLGIKVEAATSTWTQTITRHVVEHLDLVRRSLIPAIVVGVALGIFCQRVPRIGQGVLAAVGLLQTIPSLALLVLLPPIVAALGYHSVGEGSVAALLALFCYCLLPIVRNTYTGINGIQRSTIESATVLGLGPAARLTQIELPIALPTILAGVRTATVQNVGFATLGAIIGAGGLGQLILRGIRLNDTALILAGAVPAALLALALQTAIDLLEWAVVPRGLKRRAAASE